MDTETKNSKSQRLVKRIQKSLIKSSQGQTQPTIRWKERLSKKKKKKFVKLHWLVMQDKFTVL